MTLHVRLAIGLLVCACSLAPRAQTLRWVPVTESLAQPDTVPAPILLERTPTGALLAGTPRGLYRRDGDDAWVRTTADTLRDVQATSLAVRGGELFVSTSGFGVLRSANDGRTWTGSGLSGTSVSGIVTLSDGTLVAVDTRAQVYRRVRGSSAWIAVGSPGTPTYTRPGALTVLEDGTLLLQAAARLYRSTTRGSTWVDTGLQAWGNVEQAPDGTVYTVAAGGVQRSADSGATWQRLGPVPPSNEHLLSIGADGTLYLGVGVSGTSGVQKSADGVTWAWVYTSPGYFGLTALLAPDASSPALLASDRHNGLVRLDPPSGTWQTANDGFTREPRARAMETLDNRLLVAGPSLYRTSDGGQSWTTTSIPSPYSFVLYALEDGTLLNADGTLARSANLGETWETISLPPSGTLPRQPSAFLQTTTGTVLAGTSSSYALGSVGDVVRSIDGGVTWEPNMTPPPRLGPVVSLVQTDTGRLFAGHSTGGWEGGGAGGISRSDDDGLTWTAAHFGFVWSVVALPEGRLLVATEDSLFHASPSGEVWEPLGRVPQTRSTLHRTLNGEVYSYGYSSGVFRSLDDGVTWTPINDGLGNRSVASFAEAPNGDLFAGTANGVFRSTTVPEGVEPDPLPVGLAPPRPNPTTGTTVLPFLLDAASDVSLSVYDALGRRIAVLAEGLHDAGPHEPTWDARGLAPGVYLVVLRAGGTTQTRRLSVVR